MFYGGWQTSLWKTSHGKNVKVAQFHRKTADLRLIYTSASDIRRRLCVGFHLYFCVVVRVDVQYTCKPLVYSIHGHVACVTRSTTAKLKKKQLVGEASAVTEANKYQRTDHLFKTTKKRQQRNRRRWHSFNLHKDLYHGRTNVCRGQQSDV